MPTLYIHIGFHKTGSTSLQYSLKSHTKKLKDNNFKFLSANASGNSSDFIAANLNGSQALVTITNKFYDLLDTNENCDAIISAEHLSFIEDKSELLKLFDKASKLYNKIKIVAYVRKQHKLAISFKQQAAKQPHINASPSSQLCGHSLESPLPPLTVTMANYLKFDQKYTLWANVFGQDNVIFKLYDKDFLDEQCICKDFSKILGLTSPLPSKNINEGFGTVKTEIKHFLISSKAPNYIVNYFNSLNINDDDFLIIDKHLDTSTYEKYFFKHNQNLPLSTNEISKLNEINLYSFKTSGTYLVSIIKDLLSKSSIDKTLVNEYINVIKDM